MTISRSEAVRRPLTRYPLALVAALLWAAACFGLRTFGLSGLTAFVFGAPTAPWQQAVVLAAILGPVVAASAWLWWATRYSRAYLNRRGIYRPDEIRFDDALRAGPAGEPDR